MNGEKMGMRGTKAIISQVSICKQVVKAEFNFSYVNKELHITFPHAFSTSLE